LTKVWETIEALIMGSFLRLLFLSIMPLFAMACQTASNSAKSVPVERVTVGTVQRFIRNGMTSAEVVEVLGSPNMVTKNAEGNETWVYDKVYSEYEAKRSESGICLILLGGSSSKASGSSSERTLTIVVHFDKNSRVIDFSYRTTSF
jgi:outer membrane protein assembly factor BamE (lipoprotein component of BamABCDE complex)